MFSVIQNSLAGISSFSNGKLLPDQKKYVSTISYNNFEKVLEMINNQETIKYPIFSIYKQHFNNGGDNILEFIDDIKNPQNDTPPFTVDVTDNCLVMNTISLKCMSTYIKHNIKEKYLFFCLVYGCELKESTHQGIIMVNNDDKKIYLIDPNGSPTYFNDIFNFQVNYEIENMVENYFAQLKFFDLNYEYVHIGKWNPFNIVLNKRFKENEIGSGHCVVVSFTIIHLIATLDYEPHKIYEVLKDLSDDELLYMIREYSSGIYNILNSA